MELLDPDDDPVVPDVEGLSASPETFRFSCHGEDCDPASISACSISLAVESMMTKSSIRELSYRMTFAGGDLGMRSSAGKERLQRLGQVAAWNVHSKQGAFQRRWLI